MTFPCGHEKTKQNTFKRHKNQYEIKEACKRCAGNGAAVKNWPNCGHPKTVKNTYRRQCRACKNARNIQIERAKRAREAEIRERTPPNEKLTPTYIKRRRGVEPPANEDWKLRGLCRDGSARDLFYSPDEGQPLLDSVARNDAARAVCVKCPVRRLCLADGLPERYGVWGGSLEYWRVEYHRGRLSFEDLDEMSSRGPVPPAPELLEAISRYIEQYGPVREKCGHEVTVKNSRLELSKGHHLRCAACDRASWKIRDARRTSRRRRPAASSST